MSFDRATFAGQAVALRVITSSSNTYYHLYNDHPSTSSGQALGSLAAIGNSSGSLVSGSRATYQPFGSYRGTTPTQTLTDRHYTSQKENLELGLYYYNARYYAPGLGRFISADTLIPNPQNPQSFNRYSYTRNNPINRVDPSGHLDNCAALGDLNDMQGCESSPPSVVSSNPLPSIPTGPMVTFTGCDTCVWTDEEMATIQESAVVTGTRLAETLNAAHPGWNLSPSDAFLLVYGGSVNFRKTGQTCEAATGSIGCWGKTFLLEDGSHEIQVYTDMNLAGDVRWAVHEFGHAFVNTGRGHPISTLKMYQDLMEGFPDRPMTPNDPFGTWGFAGRRWGWQRSDQGRASEEFADMYLGWVYNEWEMGDEGGWSADGQMWASFMNSYMPLWVEIGN